MSKARDLADILASGSILSDGVISTTEIDGITATAAELNTLDALTRGSIIYGNSSGATAELTKGSADQVLTSDGTDISWADAGGGGAYDLFANTTVSSSVSQIDIDLSSSHDMYMVVVDNLDPPGALYFRWKRGGSFVTSGEYNYTETKTSITSRVDQSRFKIAGFDTDRHASAVIYLFNINETDGSNPNFFSIALEGGQQCVVAGVNSNNISGAVTAIRFYGDSNVTSGSVSVYTLKKS